MKTSIYNWNGRYWGFIYNDNLFDSSSNYKGWVDKSDNVWKKDGRYLGEIIQTNYILRRSHKIDPMSKIPKIPPIPPIPPIPKLNRIGKIQRIGWIDPLENL